MDERDYKAMNAEIKNQTAVEYLEDKIQSDMTFMEVLGLIRQAKEMEKQQIINSFNDGYRSGHFDDGKLGSKYFEEYY